AGTPALAPEPGHTDSGRPAQGQAGDRSGPDRGKVLSPATASTEELLMPMLPVEFVSWRCRLFREGEGGKAIMGKRARSREPIRGALSLRSGVRLGVWALCWAVFAQCALAQSESNPPAQVEPPERPARQRLGEYPEYLFREPHPAPVVETSEEFRENYLLGDWLSARSPLAAEGIKPLVLFITDPFVNAAGGRRRGFSEYDLLALDLLLDTDKPLRWPRRDFRVRLANNSRTRLSTPLLRHHL